MRFKGCEQQWVKRVSDSEFIKYNSLLTYYSDFETDEIIDGFVNPMTGEEVTFKPNWSRVPEGQSISVRGATLNIIDQAFPDFYTESSIRDVEMNLIGERYQGWIDGGIFAMTLALAIHAEGLGACFLNWSVEPAQDRAMRNHLGIADDELVITMMSAGHLKEAFSVPVSHRKPLEDVLTLNPFNS